MRFVLGLALLPCLVHAQPAEPKLIPRPVDLVLNEGSCLLECPWSVEYDASVGDAFRTVVGTDLQGLHPAKELQCFAPFPITFALIRPDTLLPDEWYTLRVEPNAIRVSATSEEGLFRGSRTLVQLLEQGRDSGSIPCLTITDHPRFDWRGMHLDVCRHFFPVAFVKEYIDLLARYKMNTFHWHLTDDQGWRIEIKQYPKLTEVGAQRSGSQVGPYSRREYDNVPYGGFYTQDEIREVVAYAAARHINVVPEIEMPGHALAALAAYPYAGCSGGPYEVNKGWGVFEDVFCAGNDSTFALLEGVLDEVIGLFPSPYIHIGGDESPKDRWKACAKCQGRMKAEGLADEHELQSYFIRRIERFVNAKGRKIIGWDEILEGGLAPNATVMSWQGIEGGIAAAKSGHDAVMTPGTHCYFDHYQGDPANEPLAIGGSTPLQKVYGYEPIPEGLTPEQARHILGAQGNLWTEYILTTDHVEYMAVPRMLALAEVLWTPKTLRNEADFIQRLEAEAPRLDERHVNYAKSLYDVAIVPRPGKVPGSIDVELKSAAHGTVMRSCQCTPKPKPVDMNARGSFQEYPGRSEWPCDSITVDGNGPCSAVRTAYTGPLTLNWNTSIEAELVRDGRMLSKRTARHFAFNQATARKITLSEPPNERYDDGGAFTLVDGITAQEKRVNTEWLGWRMGVTITVDLGQVQPIQNMTLSALNETYGWIHLPQRVEFSTSADGKTFTPAGQLDKGTSLYVMPRDNAPGRHLYTVNSSVKARYVRIAVKHRGAIPTGFPGAGQPAWLFLDEVIVH